MGKVFFSFLGVGNYLECNYEYDRERIKGVEYVQTAAQRIFCRDCERIVVAVTNAAREKHARTLEAEMNAAIEFVEIPDGSSETSLWEIFRILSDCFNHDDEVVFDVTHSYRSLPVIATMLFQYLGVVKNVKLQMMVYGAFEVLGKLEEVKKIPLAERNAPIFNLTPFIAVGEWAMAIRDFNRFGSSAAIRYLADRQMIPVIRKTVGQDENARAIERFVKEIEDFTLKLTTCRGGALCRIPEKGASDGIDFSKISDLLDEIDDATIPPMKPVLEQLKPVLGEFSNNSPVNTIAAAEWCASHRMIQQGYTFLQEGIITCIESKFPLDHFKDVKNSRLTRRKFISCFLNYALEPPDKWENELKNYTDLALSMRTAFPEELFKIYRTLAGIRNDINHCGFCDGSKPADKLARQLDEYCHKVRNALTR